MLVKLTAADRQAVECLDVKLRITSKFFEQVLHSVKVTKKVFFSKMQKRSSLFHFCFPTITFQRGIIFKYGKDKHA